MVSRLTSLIAFKVSIPTELICYHLFTELNNLKMEGDRDVDQSITGDLRESNLLVGSHTVR